MSDEIVIDSNYIKRLAHEVGFDLVGVAPAEPIEHVECFRRYLRDGFNGQMRYLARNVEKRIDPKKLLPGARSVICVAINYYSEPPAAKADRLCGKVARYAWMRDYHDIVKQRLKKLAALIKDAAGSETLLRCCVDTAPVMEKAHAARAGVGWIGKNGLLINEKFGSWLVLGELITDLPLDYDQPINDKCGTCSRCLDTCPTNALVEPYVLDARRCISYLTIESKTKVPDELRGRLNDYLFGCDICQDLCPFNRNPTHATDPELQPNPKWCRIGPDEVLTMTDEQFKRRFAAGSIARTSLEHIKESAQICRR